MWRYLALAVVFQASNLMANHPGNIFTFSLLCSAFYPQNLKHFLFSSFSDCGKPESERVGSSGGVGHSTGAESSILKVKYILKSSVTCKEKK